MKPTCYEALLDGVDKNGHIAYYSHKIPMSRFLDDIERCASGLVALGLSKGDVVTVYLPTCPQSLVLFYACSKLGLIANFVHPLVPVPLLKENLRKVNSKALFFYDVLVRDERPLQQMGQLLVRCSIADYVAFRKPLYKAYSAIMGKRVKDIVTYCKLLCQRCPTEVCGSFDDVVCYMHSGGTSGQPKIVKLTNHAFNGTAEAMIQMYRPNVKHGDYNLATLPVFHAYGLCAAMHTPLVLGCSLILVPKFDPLIVYRYLRRYNVTIWSVVPAMILKMDKAKLLDTSALSSLDVIWCGGDVVSEEMVNRTDAILKKYCKRAQLMRGYGLTETCGVCVVNNFFHYKKESCGQPMPTCQVEIWDDDGNPVSTGLLGEIVVHSPGNTVGYVDGDQCVVRKGGKDWVRTGDVGYTDDDGFVYVVDRKKRTLKIAAVNVFPSEVESCVATLDCVEEACAVGVRVDGKQFVKVFVTLKYPVEAQQVRTKIINVCKANLIRYAVPQFVEVLDNMPRTDLGKIDYKKLQ